MLSVNLALLTHPLQELLQFERLFLPEFVPQLLRLQLFLLMFLLRLCDGSVTNMETNHSSLLVSSLSTTQKADIYSDRHWGLFKCSGW